jgi:hypothetical protein
LVFLRFKDIKNNGSRIMKIWVSDKVWSRKKVKLPRNIAIAKAKKSKRIVSRAKGLAVRSQRP